VLKLTRELESVPKAEKVCQHVSKVEIVKESVPNAEKVWQKLRKNANN